MIVIISNEEAPHLRLDRNWDVALGARRRIPHRNQLGVDVAVQFIVDVEVALVLQRSAARGATEAFHMQVLLLDPHKDTTVGARCLGAGLVGAITRGGNTMIWLGVLCCGWEWNG